jgi:hypothetical protein
MTPGRFGALALLLAAASSPAAGQEEAPAWILGVSSIPPSAREVQRHPALGQVPIQVLEAVRDLDLRFLTEEERARILEKSRLEEIFQAGASAAAARDRRDAAALSPAGEAERAAEERRLETERARSLKPADSPEPGTTTPGGTSPGTRTVVFWEGHSSGRLIEAGADPGIVCSREKLDYLILWEAGEVSGYLRIRMTGWNAALGRPDFTYTAYCPTDDIPAAVSELAQGLVRAASGVPSSRLVFTVEPPETRIRVDGRLLAPGRRSLRVYKEREHLVSLELGPGTRAEYPVRSEFGKDVELSVRLEPPAPETVLVETDPPGASLHLDGIWAGTTPGQVRIFDSARVARLALPGFQDEFRVIEPGTGEFVRVTLRETEAEGDSLFDRRKERFYRALGGLAVSLPVTLLSYGLYLQSSALHTENPGNESFARRKDTAFAVFAVSTGITAGLLAGASVRLGKYIQSAR